MRIIVLGYIVRWPLGGMAWHHLQYVMGLAGLGHDVYFVEDSGEDIYCCYDPVRYASGTDCSYGVEFTKRSFERVGLGERWGYYDAHTLRWHGPRGDAMPKICSSGDLILNLSGVNPLRDWLIDVPARAFVDQDPVFTQIKHATDPAAMRLAQLHNTFFSFGENIGSHRSGIPEDGLPWQPTRQPIVLDAWEVTPPPLQGRFTTVLQWNAYAALDHEGRHYGMKSESFLPYLDLPSRSDASFELALGGTAMADTLLRKGWAIRNPLEVTADLWTYRDYIRRSRGEFSVAKHGYVVSRSGWFSDRSAAYLASGRPVVVQETGFSDWLPSGSGVLAFSTPDQAVAAVEDVNRRYPFHCRAAREVADEYFDARRVLADLVERATETIASSGRR